MIYAINYADANFENARRYNSKSAYENGMVDKVIEYSFKDIDESFKKKNKKIFEYERGAGLWIWKPYIILKTLDIIDNGDYLCYADSGSIYVNKIQHLINCMENHKTDIMLFELPLLDREFTKRETFEIMEHYNYSQNQILSSFLLLKKSDHSRFFINEWLKYMQDERVVSPKRFMPEINEFEGFYSHREDQSVLSVLARKNNLEVFRDPSDFGDRPWQYFTNHWTYNPKRYNNSCYPKIFISNRKTDPIKYYKKERVLTILNKFKLYTYYNRKIKNILVKLLKGSVDK